MHKIFKPSVCWLTDSWQYRRCNRLSYCGPKAFACTPSGATIKSWIQHFNTGLQYNNGILSCLIGLTDRPKYVPLLEDIWPPPPLWPRPLCHTFQTQGTMMQFILTSLIVLFSSYSHQWPPTTCWHERAAESLACTRWDPLIVHCTRIIAMFCTNSSLLFRGPTNIDRTLRKGILIIVGVAFYNIFP